VVKGLIVCACGKDLHISNLTFVAVCSCAQQRLFAAINKPTGNVSSYIVAYPYFSHCFLFVWGSFPYFPTLGLHFGWQLGDLWQYGSLRHHVVYSVVKVGSVEQFGERRTG
jgi:hypothetical protein